MAENASDPQSWTDDRFFDAIAELVMCHSPSGVEEEINRYLLERLSEMDVEHWQDEADNIVVRIKGAGKGALAITAHKDSYGLYDEGLNREVMTAARAVDIPLQISTISGFGSDASIAMKFGHVARAACLAFPTQNTHGFEIAHLSAIRHCCEVLKSVIQQSLPSDFAE